MEITITFGTKTATLTEAELTLLTGAGAIRASDLDDKRGNDVAQRNAAILWDVVERLMAVRSAV